MQIERELKFRLSARAQGNVWALLPGAPAPERRRLDSSYYDTPDFRLRDAGAALRLRRDGSRRLMCFKTESTGTHGLPQRNEWEALARSGKFSPEVLPCKDIKAVAGIDLKRLAGVMLPVFDTRFVRRSAEVALRDGTRVVVCVDIGTICAGRLRAPLRELELELVAGKPASLIALAETLVEPLRLELGTLSKAEQGYLLIKARPGGPVKAQLPHLRRGMSVEDAMLAVFDSCRMQVQANLFGTLNSPDPEFLHQLRIGVRRLCSALRVFRPVASEDGARQVSGALKPLASPLGRARDWDVFYAALSRCASPPARRVPESARVIGLVRRRRNAALKQAREALSSIAFQKFLLRLMRWMEERPWRTGGMRGALGNRAEPFCRGALAAQERKALRRAKHIDWTDTKARHRVRIVVKRLRYTCEFFSDLVPPRMTRRYLRELRSVQDILGELNDLSVGRELLRELRKAADPRAAGLVRDCLAARESLLIRRLGAAWRAWKKEGDFG